MNCRTARALLLTAEIPDLEGRGDGDLSQHLRSCTPCRGLATELLQTMDELRRTLETPEPTGIQSVRRAVLDAQRRGTRVQRFRRLVPLAAAAGLAGLLLLRRGPQIVPVAVPPAPLIHEVSVTAPPGHSLAVLHTDDPNIVVIWFF
jgi:anti-sigma factor RsiW